MARIRVHELAKKLGKDNKEILNYLTEKGISVKSHMSSIEEEQVAMVEEKFKKKEGKTEVKPETKAETNTETKAEEKPPVKKKNITQVFHPQNSRTGIGRNVRQGGKSAGSRQGRTQGSARPARPQGSAMAQARPQQSTEGTPVRPQTENAADTAQVKAQSVSTPSQASAPVRPQAAAAQAKPQSAPAQSGAAPARPQAGQNTGVPGRRNEGQSRPAGGQGRDGQNRSQGRDGQSRSQNRDGQNRGQGRDSQNRDGQNRRFRDGSDARNQGQNRSQGRDGQNRGQGRDGQNRDGQNRDGQNRRFRDGGDARNQGQNRSQGRDGQNRSQGRNQGSRSNASSMMEKPITKESRNRNDRGRNDRNQDKVDKFESKSNRLGQSGKNSQKNNNSRGGKTNTRQPAKPAPVQEKKEDEIRTITLPETMTIKELADAMKVQAAAIVKKLFLEGMMVTVNQEIDFEKAEEIALEYNCIAEKEEKVDVIEELLREDEENEDEMVSRPPVVCVMGHVDHGKTSLLDAIRHTHVIAKEAGGITQHIGAYVVEIDGQKITFLDTPGHEAFTAMRMRGANATDIAILVVAADDGVMPQTVEAINHAKAANTEIIVAINKIDKPSANIDRVKQELSEYGLIPEDWGGSTIFVPVSAHTHEGIDTLLEMILLTAEVGELKANPNRSARGLVIEAELDKGKGPVATVLVQKGTLHVGDPIACGASYGKVRAMMDDKGRRVKEAAPSTPVEILGLSDVPNAGEIFVVCENDKEARSFAETFVSQGREKLLEETRSRMSLDDLFSQIQAGDLKELNIIVKADVQGSVEAVKQSLLKLSNEEVVVKIIHGGVGAINESDVSLASASNAIIIGFNVRPDATAKATAEREGVDVRLYRVIYDAIADVEAAMKGMLDPVFEEKVIGHAEVRQLFKASGVGTIAGSYVLDGTFQRGCSVRISREGKQIFEGALASLKRFKDDVKEVRAGYECGLVFEKFNDLQELDQVEAYIMVEVPR
ncbi:MAG: translation initiation factor IF-2 [Firmicutes bacterium]|nr:translation initiation factor IF-2 [Lachnospiraceae bacterium]MDD6066724.1 translation initiation factor IF-2 [Bacillota bacterium]MDY2818620.1 translation initiation factor IF-2 [Hominisplanchenecus sp.]